MTPVTVIAAGPCPVVPGAHDRASTATTPSSSPSTRCAERKLTRARARASEAARRRRRTGRSSSSAAASTAPSRARRSRSQSFEPGDEVKVAGIGIGKGFQGTIKRHNFSSGPRSHGSHNVRAPGSIGASATPSRVFKGTEDGRADGRQAGHPARAQRVTASTPRRTCCSSRARFPGHEERARRGARLMAALEGTRARRDRRQGQGRLARGGVLRRRDRSRTSCTRRCGPSRPRTARARCATKSRGSSPAAAPSRGARRAPAAPAPARSAPRSSPAAAHVFAKVPRSFTVKVNRKARGRPRSARRSPRTPGAARSRCSTAPTFDEPSTKHAPSSSSGAGLPRPSSSSSTATR